ncbi:hypothetical protein D3C80_1977330 [compost metagenome]
MADTPIPIPARPRTFSARASSRAFWRSLTAGTWLTRATVLLVTGRYSTTAMTSTFPPPAVKAAMARAMLARSASFAWMVESSWLIMGMS